MSCVGEVASSMRSYPESRRYKNHGGHPDVGVYTRLQPSNIHGVGVFAIRRIEKGTPLFADDEEIIWVDEGYVAGLSKEIKKLYDDFAIIKDGKYGCPVNFNL